MIEPAASEAPDRGLFARLTGIVVSPEETLRSVLRFPRPAAILFVVCAVLALATAAPQFTAGGRQAALDLQIREIERRSGEPVTPAMYERMEQMAGMGPYFAILGAFVAVPVATVLFSALYWATFNILLGGTAGFNQVLGIVAHSQVITALGTLIGVPLQFLQTMPTPAGPFNLGALAPMLDANGFAAAVLGSLTVFQIWATIVTALGLALLYRRRLWPIAAGLLVFHVAVVAGFAALPFLFRR